MNKQLSQIFKNIPEIEPAGNLEALIKQKIGFQREKALKRKLIFSYLGLAGSSSAVFGAILGFGGVFLHSEFWSIVSLLFSDLVIVAKNWETYAYSLMETFPVINVIMILIPILALFISFSFLLSLRQKNHYMHIHNRFKFV